MARDAPLPDPRVEEIAGLERKIGRLEAELREALDHELRLPRLVEVERSEHQGRDLKQLTDLQKLSALRAAVGMRQASHHRCSRCMAAFELEQGQTTNLCPGCAS